MISNGTENSKDDSQKSQWTYLTLKDLESDAKYSPSVLMGHYLIVISHQGKSEEYESDDDYENIDDSVSLFAVDLRDNSIQETQVPRDMFYHQQDYTLTKYKDNQIIKFGGEKKNQASGTIVQVTIESFKPLSIKCTEIHVDSNQPHPKLSGATAQIYMDHLYVFGGTDEKNFKRGKLWSFDLNNLTWKLCETTGAGPGARFMPNSSIIGDKLFIYGGGGFKNDKDKTKDIFVLDFNSMNWTRIEQVEKFLLLRNSEYGVNFNGHAYKDHLLIVTGEKKKGSFQKIDQIYCWNPDTNCWSNFQVDGIGIPEENTNNLIVYKDSLIVVGQDDCELAMATLSLETLGLLTLESEEQKRLFLNEEESDISFKIEDKIIPAHKNILVQKSRYFANLFKSDMAESRQQIIEINDCEYSIFKEFLRFIYYEEVQLEDVNFAVKLLGIADKYTQDDLHGKCENWCLKFLRHNLTADNLSGLIQFLDQQDDQDIELKNWAFNYIVNHSAEILQEENLNAKLCEDFLIKNITIETISKIVNLMYSKTKEIPQGNIINLRKACFDFVKENRKTLQEKGILEKFPPAFLAGMIFYLADAPKQDENSL